MIDRSTVTSPFESVLIAAFVTSVTVLWLLWLAGILLGGIVGARLSGETGQGMVAIFRTFPRVGLAWSPPVSSLGVWMLAVAIGTAGLSVASRMVRFGRFGEGGAHWATRRDLHRAGLLLKDQRPMVQHGDRVEVR